MAFILFNDKPDVRLLALFKTILGFSGVLNLEADALLVVSVVLFSVSELCVVVGVFTFKGAIPLALKNKGEIM